MGCFSQYPACPFGMKGASLEQSHGFGYVFVLIKQVCFYSIIDNQYAKGICFIP